MGQGDIPVQQNPPKKALTYRPRGPLQTTAEGKETKGVKRTERLHLVFIVRMRRAVPPRPHLHAWQ